MAALPPRQRAAVASMIDVDHFKAYNDHSGHPQGDAVPAPVRAICWSTRWRRPGDIVARYGGEEFVVLLPRHWRRRHLSVANKLAAALRDADIYHPRSPAGHLTSASARRPPGSERRGGEPGRVRRSAALCRQGRWPQPGGGRPTHRRRHRPRRLISAGCCRARRYRRADSCGVPADFQNHRLRLRPGWWRETIGAVHALRPISQASDTCVGVRLVLCRDLVQRLENGERARASK